ncbi:MAG: transposase [Dehalococcoidia bacterium]|nr:transposase [Dehalococcoidia bacterium]
MTTIPPMLTRSLLKGAREKHPDNPIASNAADSGYEEMGVAPIIALNRRNGPDALSVGELTLSSDGQYTCLAGFQVVYWGKESRRNRLKFRCPAALGKRRCLFQSACSSSSYGRTFYLHSNREYRLVGPGPRGTALWQEKYTARTSVERAYSEEKDSHRLDSPRVRGLPKIKIHVYMALCGQVAKKIGAAITKGLIKPQPSPHPIRA